MNNNFVQEYADKSRREILIAISNLFENEEELAAVVGQNILLDCTLYYYARDNSANLTMLSKYLDVHQMLSDFNHVQKSADIRKHREKLMR